MDRMAFFKAARAHPFGGSMSQSAVDGIEAILSAWDSYGDDDANKLAYILATAFHESDRFKTMEEYASGAAYEGRADLGNTRPGDGRRFKGRGFVQITGRRNYADWSERLDIDLIADPQRASEREISARIIVEGMMLGTFTGKRLGQYIGADFKEARRVVNGTDRANDIAGYAKDFQAALEAAAELSSAPWPAPAPFPPLTLEERVAALELDAVRLKSGTSSAIVHAVGNHDFSRVDVVGQRPVGWTMPAPGGVVSSGGQYGPNRVEFDASTSMLGPLEPVDVEAAYHCSARFWIVSGTPAVNVGVDCHDASGTFLGSRYPAANSLIGMTSLLGKREVGGIISGEGLTKNNFYTGTKFIRRRAHIGGAGVWAVDYFKFRELERGQIIRTSLWKARPGGNKAWNSDLFNDFVAYLYANGGVGLIDVPGTYDLNAIINAGQITGVIPWSLVGMGLTTKLRRATASMGTVVDLLGSNIEVSNLAIDGGRDTLGTGGTHGLTIEGGGNNRASKLDVRNFHSAGIILSGTTPHAHERCEINGCYIDGMDRAWNGFMLARIDHSAIVNSHVRRVRPLLDTAATPCLAIQTKDYCDYALISGCTAYDNQTGLRAGGADDANDDDNSDVDNFNLTVIGCKIKGGGVAGAALAPIGARFVRQKFGMVVGLDVDCQNIPGMSALMFQFLCENMSVQLAVRSVHTADQASTSSNSRAVVFDSSDDCQVTIEMAKSIGPKPIKYRNGSANNTVYMKHVDGVPTFPASYSTSSGGGAGNKIINLRALIAGG